MYVAFMLATGHEVQTDPLTSSCLCGGFEPPSRSLSETDLDVRMGIHCISQKKVILSTRGVKDYEMKTYRVMMKTLCGANRETSDNC